MRYRRHGFRAGYRPLIGALALALLALVRVPANAHPLGNFTINHLTKISVDARTVTLKYILDIAEIPTFQIMQERGVDRSHAADARLQGWAHDEVAVVAGGLHASVNGAPLPLQAGIPRVAARPGAGGLPTLYWIESYHATLPAHAGNIDLWVDDEVYEGRIGWRDVILAPDTEPTDELRAYPSALLGSPRHVNGVRVAIAPDGTVFARATIDVPAAATTVGAVSQIRSNALSDMLAKGAANPWIVFLTILTAVGLGALHALEPGHGKTLLAVSLVGARATAKQALILAVGLTFAHTAGVLALGILMLVAARWIVPESVYPWITLASGVVVAALGANALSRYVKTLRGSVHSHEHGHQRMDSSAAGEGHAHDHGHDHHHHVPAGSAPLTFSSVMLVAMTGNIAPCPAALVVLLAALALHQLAYGLLVIIAFSAGLAGVLTGLGIALVRGAAYLSDKPAFERVVRYGPLISASVIAVIGAAMLGQSAALSTLHAPANIVTILVLAAILGYALSPGHSHGAAEHGHDHRHSADGAHGQRAIAFESEAP